MAGISGENGFCVRTMSQEELFSEIEKDILFFNESEGGVTFSGGEPLVQEPFLASMLKKCQDKRIHSAVDTSGVGGEGAVETLALADLVLFDIKGLNDEALLRETGAQSDLVMSNLEGLAKRGQRIWLRLPLIPGFGLMNDSLQNIKKWLFERAGWFERVNLLPFHRNARHKYEKLSWTNPLFDGPVPSEVIVRTIAEELRDVHYDVRIGG